MDDKMKDAVKITVIATGFREVRTARQRRSVETHTSFSSALHRVALDDPMEFPRRLSDSRHHRMSPEAHHVVGGSELRGQHDA